VLSGYNVKTGSNNIDIGNQGSDFESSTIRIGTPGTHTNTLIAGIYNVPVSGLSVVVGSGGVLGTSTSSARFKENIQPMDSASEAILSLQPVTFQYKKEVDPKAVPQFGLVAEQVEKVNPDLIARDEQGKPFSVRYEAVNAMLLNEFLKEHRKVGEQQATIAELKANAAKQAAQLAQQQKAIATLTSQMQKVSGTLEQSIPVSRLVTNDQLPTTNNQ
jgi:trimeric autotransporter adhesin